MSDSKFKLERVPGAPVSTEELLADIRRVAESVNTNVVTMAVYDAHGKYYASTVARRFGGGTKPLPQQD